jgi:hypothetical protein
MTDSGSWECVELKAAELANHSFESISVHYRGDKPLCVFTALEHLDGYVAINIFAPLGHAFRAAATSSVIPACRTTITHLYSDQAARECFLKDLRKAKIRKGSPQIRLLAQYADVFGVSGPGVPSLSIERPYAEHWRYWSSGFPAKAQDAVVARLEREVAQFGEYAFINLDESAELADPAGASSIGAYLFHNVGYRFHPTEPERGQFKQAVLHELKLAVSRLEAGLGFNTPIEPVWLIKAMPKFLLSPQAGENPPEYRDELARQILSYRSRLVRLLGWPHQYAAVVNEIARFRAQAAELGSGRLAPYDVDEELCAYIAEMQQRYPVVAEAINFT